MIPQIKISCRIDGEAKENTIQAADTFKELKKSVTELKGFVPVTEKLFYYALEVLPPIYLPNGTFQMGEEYASGLFWTFGEKNGQYFGCLCNKNYSLNNF